MVGPPEIPLSRTGCKGQGGDQEVCSGELFIFCLFGTVCVCVCGWFCFYLVHMLTGKRMYKSSENLQKSQAGIFSILYVIESFYQKKWLSEKSKTSALSKRCTSFAHGGLI